jgi:hypothetical protein
MVLLQAHRCKLEKKYLASRVHLRGQINQLIFHIIKSFSTCPTPMNLKKISLK